MHFPLVYQAQVSCVDAADSPLCGESQIRISPFQFGDAATKGQDRK
jgi:hypothetical protein